MNIRELREEKTFDKIIGKTIKILSLSNTEDCLKFIDTEDKPYLYLAEADCCSESYFWGFENLENLRSKILKVDIVDGENPYQSRQEEDKTEKIIITTESGETTFNMTNSSNGYYSGWISFAGTRSSSLYGEKKYKV